jgi:hypothetical protein
MREADGERQNARDARIWLRTARRGDLAGAWRVSDRIAARGPSPPADRTPRHFQRIWDGTPVAGRRVLVRCYHGLGDTIQFVRYAPRLAAEAREVTWWAQPELLPLVASARGVDRVLPLHDGAPDIDYDVDVESMELPYVFRSTLTTIPAEVPYLRVPAAALPPPPPNVGIAWRGGRWDTRRSIPFMLLARLLRIPGVTWWSLQHRAEAHEVHANLRRLDAVSVAALASVMQGLDLVVSIDSLCAHLAGALGRPVWTLLARPADWRWLVERDDSPWYPSMRLFRQRRPGDWPQVLEDVARELMTRALSSR